MINSNFKRIYNKLKISPNSGGVYLSKILDYCILNNVKPLNIVLNDLIRKVIKIEGENKRLNSVRSNITRYIEHHIREDKILTEFFDTCDKITSKNFIINMLLLYNKEEK